MGDDSGAVALTMVRRVSPLALESAIAVMLTGPVASWLHLDRPAVGGFNWRRLTTALAGGRARTIPPFVGPRSPS